MSQNIIQLINNHLKYQYELDYKIMPNRDEIVNDKKIYRAIILETAEAIECLPWKWWKKQEINKKNLYIELVDIYHFLLSLINLQTDKIKTDLIILIDDIYNTEQINKINFDNIIDTDIENLINTFEKLMLYSLNQNLNLVAITFTRLVKMIMDYETLDKIYFGKNMLNEIRSKYGYKTGQYKKVINGKEDNDILFDLIEKGYDLDYIKTYFENINSIN